MAGRKRLRRWIIAAAVTAVVLAVGVPYVYIHLIEGPAPAPLRLATGHTSPPSGTASPPATAAEAQSVAGRWQAGHGSVAGYRVKEVLLGQDNIAVGRSRSVTGHLTITGSKLTQAAFTVPVASIHSDQSQRDVQFDGRIMDAAAYPAASFALTRSVRLTPLPATGVVRVYQVAGNLTMHGHTRPVTFSVQAKRTASTIEVSGSIPVTFADWGIPNPSFGSFVTTQNHGELEFLLVFTKA